MHITHVNFAKGFRGGERQTLNLIEGLARLDVAQTLVCRTGSELKTRMAVLGLPTLEAGHPLLGHWSPPPSHIIHVHEARGAYWAAIEHAFRKSPYIITRRIPNPISTGRLTGIVYKNAAHLVGVSVDVSTRLAQQTGCRVDTILDSSTLHDADPGKVAAIRKKLGGRSIIGHVGALHDHHKGQSVLIEAFHKLSAIYPDARLLLVGDGPDKARFEMLAKSDPRIFFAGFQSDVGSWIAAMDVFAFPSREEGLGSSVLDAMMLGVPVVASAAGGLPELIGANQHGLQIDSHDPDDWANALQRLLTDQALRFRLIDAARKFAQQHDIGAMTASYLKLYKNILNAA